MILSQLIAWLSDPEHWSGETGLPNRVLQHLGFTLVTVLVAALIAIPLGLWVGHTGRGGVVLVATANSMRALPTLGLVTALFLLSPSNREVVTVLALVVLAVPPILAGTYAGVQSVDRGVVDAAAGMGMTSWQRLWQAELPGALPLILGGLRNATLQVVATVAVAAYIGLGGLGRLLLDGLRSGAEDSYAQVLAGALATALIAVVLDLLLAAVQRAVVPTGVRLAAAAARGGR